MAATLERAGTDVADFQIRHGTQDREVFEGVVINNQYRLPDSLPADSVIIDIGANVGAFAVACLLRGAGTVVCFEPCPLNFEQLIKNTAPWPGRAVLFRAAIWRSDANEAVKFVRPGKHTACGGVMPAHENPPGGMPTEPVIGMGLDELLLHVTDGGKRRVDILKVDAEGSEYPILYTSKRLSVVDQILGETHQFDASWPDEQPIIGGFSAQYACASGMKTFLEGQGFSVTQEAESTDNTINTLFFATRSTPPEQK